MTLHLLIFYYIFYPVEYPLQISHRDFGFSLDDIKPKVLRVISAEDAAAGANLQELIEEYDNSIWILIVVD